MLRLLIALLVLSAGCAQPQSRIEPLRVQPLVPSASEWRVIDHVVVITDASWTMNSQGLLPAARELTRSLVTAMPQPDSTAKGAPQYEASLIAFGGDERIAHPHGPFDRAQLTLRAQELRPLGDPPFGGTTPLARVIDEVAKPLASRTGPAAIVIIGDGLADNEEAALEATRRLVSARRDPTCIHAVHAGESAEGRALLEQVMRLGSGCGSMRRADSLASASAVEAFERAIFLDRAPLPAVAAAPPASDRCGGRIVLRGVTFELNRAVVRPDSTPVLDYAAEQLRECASRRVAVEGHTCALGSDDYNRTLAERRAGAVREYLLAHGVADEQLIARGVGEAQPVASNDSEDGRAQNRRVELVPVD